MKLVRSLVVFGTRSEAVKMAPVVKALASDPRFRVRVAVTGQHREMLDQVLSVFDIAPDYDLNLMRHGQTPGDVVAGVLAGLTPIVEQERPDIVLVHGDTVTTFAAALAAFYCKAPVGHVEAGLRTCDRYDPFPEEMHRRLAGVLADLHFAPTWRARENLLKENVDPETVYVTGNTAIDALLARLREDHVFGDPRVGQAVASGRRLILLTTHRRENWGEPLRRVYGAVRQLLARHKDLHVLFPVHKNPLVRDAASEALGGHERVTLVDPLDYDDMVHAMRASAFILTDSGGLQEEAPALGKPVLVLRETTERPEGVLAGTCLKVGTDPDRIVAEATRLLVDEAAYARMARAVNPYGDGQAAGRVRDGLLHWAGLAPRPADYQPAASQATVAKG